MKLSKEEILTKVSEKVENQDVAIELMEDISDSMEIENTPDTTEIEKLKTEIESKDSEIADLKRKYKERFLSGEVTEPEKEEPGLEEQEIIDVKEI